MREIRMPAGRYYLGDPCYSVPKDRWMEWLEAADYENNRDVLIAELDGHKILGLNTRHGDGVYEDRDGNIYGVDSGLIGLVPVEIAENRYGGRDGCGRIVEFPETFKCHRSETGILKFGHIVINTDYEDSDEEF